MNHLKIAELLDAMDAIERQMADLKSQHAKLLKEANNLRAKDREISVLNDIRLHAKSIKW